MIEVLIADDQALVRGGLRSILEREEDIAVVGEAKDGAEAVALSQRLDPQVVLMDIRMPQLDGIEATRRVVRAPSPPRVVVLTTYDADEYLYDALKAGASGFLLKDTERSAWAMRSARWRPVRPCSARLPPGGSSRRS